MGKFLIPLALLGISAGLYFVFIEPLYAEIQTLSAQVSRLDLALTKSKELQEVRNSLNSKRTAFRPGDVDRLHKLLPDHIDNVRLIIDIDDIAARYNLAIQNISFTGGPSNPSGQNTDQALFGSMQMSFAVTARYDQFLLLLRDLEKSLRIVDVVALTVNPNEEGDYNFAVTLRTYWLK
jgi:hypothetical protein